MEHHHCGTCNACARQVYGVQGHPKARLCFLCVVAVANGEPLPKIQAITPERCAAFHG